MPPTSEIELLLEATKVGDLTAVNLFLTNTHVVNQININDNQALRFAAENGHLEMVNRLLEFESVVAELTARNNYALRSAAEHDHLEVVNRLLEFEAVIAQLTAQDNCALRFAAYSGHLEMVNRLLKFEAVVNQLTAESNYALRYAAEHGYLDVVNRLLEFEAVVAQVTCEENWALDWAGNNGHLDVVNRLLEIADVRQGNLHLHNSSGCITITQGLKRALWLSLQEEPGFAKLDNFDSLEAYATAYLRQNPDWVNASFTKERKKKLVKSLSAQVLAAAYCSPFIILQKRAAMDHKIKISTPILPLSLLERIETYVGAQTEGLAHFNEHKFKPTQTLAFNIYRARYQETRSTWMQRLERYLFR